MKLLLENWRRYLAEEEEMASFARGDMFGDFMKQNPELTLKVFQKMGAGKNMLNIIQRYTREGAPFQEGNQMVAVLAGKKPMFYSNPVRWTEPDMDCVQRTAGPPEPTEVLEEAPDECPDIDIGNFILKNAHKLNIMHAIEGNMFILGRPENVKEVSVELKRVKGDVGRLDTRFHRIIGKNLGYPPEDIEAFIRDPRRPTGK
tara:strand:- start:118 stop:723 length:606 start_codon:yes stop_codon:yes gene_type:complete